MKICIFATSCYLKSSLVLQQADLTESAVICAEGGFGSFILIP